ncbi:alpha/beta fold hydrolase [Heyndrickxia oleronia]|jgi:pimeloyl-ACP methyl ester carboxylesterase|uniref:alpha/beta fold hydrolase n=1 Tax=Heyndrickxia oleronia TaxID=38875 RepID=UPI001C0EE757|nr:alpha/beta hydrolase [Heyndrickxia oleronia]MBU5215034.1 alpha/beta hydrolase [Heyndrickxia oleronia]MCI1591250.1 alpha/beta hydrolase [Heyndrickxia oleronia]MCI1615665.1 alpha/beta hydrolase [Heyndrickxia oleronia]MCI1746315.1 alpha/beta hydrolase [Heyndrickxia oleronia]MCI1763986.1 alpha/beta hydrolase [Heyndrickxia oleronia]
MSITVSKMKRNIDGIDLYYEEYINEKAKDTFVLIHGFLSSTFSYRRLIPLLAESYNIISVDLPPFGQSGKHYLYQYSYRNMAHSVLHLIKSLDYSRIYIIGHSMGGQIALHMMKQKPDMINKGILLCSSGYLKPVKPSLKLLSHLPFFHHFVRYYLEKSGVQKNVENVVYDHAMIDAEMLRGYEEPFTDKNIFKGLAKMVRDHEGDLLSDDLKNIQIPCLLIWGEQDRVVPLAIGEKLSKDLPNAQLVILKNTGHLIPEEKPNVVFTYIQHFVKQA